MGTTRQPIFVEALKVERGIVALALAAVEEVMLQAINAFGRFNQAEGIIDQARGGDIVLGGQGIHQKIDGGSGARCANVDELVKTAVDLILAHYFLQQTTKKRGFAPRSV